MTLKELAAAYQEAVAEAEAEYQEHGTWHVEMCNCDRCQTFETWYALPWYKQLLALWIGI